MTDTHKPNLRQWLASTQRPSGIQRLWCDLEIARVDVDRHDLALLADLHLLPDDALVEVISPARVLGHASGRLN